MTDEEKFILKKKWTDIELADIFEDSHNLVSVGRVITPVVLVNTERERIEGSRVDDKTRIFTQKEAATSTSPIDITTTEDIMLEGILAILDADANAADRDLTVTVTSGLISTLASTLLTTTAVRATANQIVSVLMTGGHSPNWWQNDNGTVTVVADENPLPLFLETGSIISTAYSNDQAADVLEVEIWYTKPNITDE